MDNFVPPASVRPVCHPRWRRFLVMDGGGHYWTGSSWSENPADATLFMRESDAMRADFSSTRVTRRRTRQAWSSAWARAYGHWRNWLHT